jgi:uncharacterized protein (TIGR02099 family)
MCFAVGLLAVRVLLATLDGYKAELAAEISKQVAAPVTIGQLRTHIHRFSPQLVLKDIAILSPANSPAIQLNELRLGINLIDLLLKRDLLSATRITLIGVKLTVKRQADGSISIVGLKAGDNGQPLWLLQGRKYLVLQSSLTWQDEQRHGKPLTFDDVNLMIANEGEQHRVHILMNLTKQQGESLKVVLNVQGNLFEPAHIQATGFIEGKAIHLPEWVTVDLPLTLKLKSGVSDFKLWGTWQNAQLETLTGEVQAQQLYLTRQHKTDFVAPHFSTRFFWHSSDLDWQLAIEQFLLETAHKKYPATRFSVSGKQTQNATLFSPQLDIHEFTSLAEFFAPLEVEPAKLLAQAQAKGQLDKLRLSLDFNQQRLNIHGKFSQLSIAPLLTFPGVENLTGRIDGNEQQGKLQFSTTNAQLKYPHLFRSTLPISQLQGVLTWQQTADNWTLTSPLLVLNSPDIQTKSRLQLIIPKTEQPVFIDLQTAFSGKDMSKAPTYYPTAIMSKTLVDWLDHAFIGGNVPKGGFLLVGNLKDFPFTNGDGVFEVLFNAQQLELLYHPDWPHLTELAGEVLFVQDRLQVNLTQGKSNKINIQQAEIGIPSLNKGEMVNVDGKFTAAITDTLDFLQITPLNLPIHAVLAAISPEGNTQADLKLTIPLEDYIPAKVDGEAKLNNANLTVNALDLLVDKVSGAIKFNEVGIYADKLSANTLGYPIQIKINSDATKTTINATGRTSIDDLRKQFVLPIWSIAQGSSDYQLQLQLPYGNKPSELSVQSMLAGISLDLPAHLAKTSKQQRTLALNFQLQDQSFLPLRLSYDNQLKAALNFDIKQRKLHAGQVLIGEGEVGKIPDTGLKLEINRDPLSLNDWLAIGFSRSATADIPSLALLKEVKVHSNSSFWKKTPLGAFDLNLKSAGKQWTGRLDSRYAKGELTIPFNLTGSNRISFNMDELDLSLLKQFNQQDDDGVASPKIVPESVSLLSLNSRKTRWQGVELGQLNLVAERIKNGISFNNITLNGDKQKLSLSGDWQVNGNLSTTRAKGRLEMLKVDELFKQFDLSKNFTQTSGTADFDMSWRGAPKQFSLNSLQGQLNLDIKEGRILGIEPGFGRILGVLAVAQWIKRLQLDFSDIYEAGLSYNSITGHFDLAQGKAHTNNLIVDAIPAKITITGDTDLVHRTVNQSIMVAPKSADALPIAGTIMGKVASFIGKSLTGKDQDGFFFGSHYLLKGEWGKVQVIPHHENDGVLQKTWSGLTDFSWLNQPTD